MKDFVQRIWRRHRTGVNAALFNLSGLSLGYFYLRRIRLAVAHAAGTALLAVISGSGAAAGAPGPMLVVVALWLAWMGFHAWWIGIGPDGTERPRHTLIVDGEAVPVEDAGRSRRIPQWLVTAAAAVLATALLTGFLTLRAGADREFEAGLAAHQSGDCDTASEHYRRLSGGYRFAFKGEVAAAAEKARDCAGLLEARQAADDGRFESSIKAYETYLEADNALAADSVRTELAETRLDYATAERTQTDRWAGDFTVGFVNAYEQYGILLTDFPETDPAQQVEAELLDMYETAVSDVASEPKCDDQLDVQQFFSGLPSDIDVDYGPTLLNLARPVIDEARTVLPDLLFSCGEAAFEDGSPREAEGYLDDLMITFPDDPNAEAASAILDEIAEQQQEEEEEEQRQEEEAAEQERIDDILAEIADARANGADLSAPSSSGSSGSGSVTLEIGNSAGVSLEVLYTGPETGSFTVSGCSDCSTQCADGTAVWEEVSLPAGDHEMVVQANSSDVIPYYGEWGLDSGNLYQECYYIE